MKRVLCVLAKTKSGDVDPHLFLVDAELNMFTAKEKLEVLAKNLTIEYSKSTFGMEIIRNNGGFLGRTDVLNDFKNHKKKL